MDELLEEIEYEEVAQRLAAARPWNAPGPDRIPYGFLRMCGAPLISLLTTLLNASLRLGYFPAIHRRGRTVVLPKPNKTPAQRRTAAGYRPITLLSTTGKLLESLIAARLGRVAEEIGALPTSQMGNRASRSTEGAIAVVLETIRATWARGGIVAMLLLDLIGAFDQVHHEALLHKLITIGYPTNFIKLIRSFLQDRSTQLVLYRTDMNPTNIGAGVPQGSPLSPILFLHYIIGLYYTTNQTHGILTIGFANNTNLLSIAHTPQQARNQLLTA